MNSAKRIEVIIPMAGKGSRFAVAGYGVAKPFIQIQDTMMIEYVLKGLAILNTNAVLVIRKQHEEEYITQLKFLQERYNIIWTSVEGDTAGATCSALAARHVVQDKRRPVLFADCDNIFLQQNLSDFIADAEKRELDGSLLTFPSASDAFSYVRLNENKMAQALQEKQVISPHALAGAYYFSSFEMFEDNAIDMLIYGDAVKQEYYMSQVYNHALRKQARIGIWEVRASEITCLGTPEQMATFIDKRAGA